MSFRATETDSRREPKTEGLRLFLGYLEEVATDTYRPTVVVADATHIHAYDPLANAIRVVPIGSDAAGVIMRRVGGESYRIYATQALVPSYEITVSPGDDLATALMDAAEGDRVYIQPGTYTQGELAAFADGLEIFGPEATLTPVTREGVTAYEVVPQVVINGTGANTFNLNGIDGTYLHDIGIRGAVHTPGNGQTGNGVMHGTNTVIRRAKIYDTDKAGLSGLLTNLLIEDSELTGNGIGQYSGLSSALKTTRFVTGRRLLIRGNHYYGWWTDCQCPGSLLEDSIVEGNYGTGGFTEISVGPFVYRRVYFGGNNTGANAGRSDLVVTSSPNGSIEDCIFRPTSAGRTLWLREDNRAGLNTPGDPDYNGTTGACDYGHRLAGITVSGCDLGTGQLRVQYDNGTSTLIDHTTDQVLTNPIGGGTITLEGNV